MKKNLLIIILILGMIAIAIFYWFFNSQLAKTTPASSSHEVKKEPTKTKEIERKDIKSIPLEKPPFIKE